MDWGAHKPTLRVGIPIIENGNKKGIIIINLFMGDFLKQIAEDPYANVYIIDKDGYFLLHPNSKYSFNRYTKRNHSIQKEFDNFSNLETTGVDYLQRLLYKPMQFQNDEGLRIVMHYNTDLFIKDYDDLYFHSIKVGLLILVLSFVLAYIFVLIPKSLQYKLTNTTQALKEKNNLLEREKEAHQKVSRQKLQTLYSLIDLIEARDSYTAGHAKRVAHYCEVIGNAMHYDEENILLLRRASLLHDIGKIVTPDSVLLKPGKLTKKEYKIIQNHSEMGYQFLRQMESFELIADIIRYHHERYDGKGYPQSIKGDEIPELSRIMTIADSFDAMTSRRIYRTELSKEEALNEIKNGLGTQFDPAIGTVALSVLKVFEGTIQKSLVVNISLEEERFAYFYKDPITSYHNTAYLKYLVNQKDFKTKEIWKIDIHKMSQYNRNNGWSAGDDLLEWFASKLEVYTGTEKIFRIHGDDFIIFSDKFNIDKMNALKKELEVKGATISWKKIDSIKALF